MNLIIQGNKVVGTATDAYDGPEQFIAAPADFDITRMGDYVFANGGVTLNLVPASVTRFQALAALSNAGLLANAQAAVNASTNPLVPLAWNNAQTFDRASPTIAALATALNLTSAQLDALFIAAAGITA